MILRDSVLNRPQNAARSSESCRKDQPLTKGHLVVFATNKTIKYQCGLEKEDVILKKLKKTLIITMAK